MIEFLVWGVFVLVAFIIGVYFGDNDARENFKDYWYSGDEWCHDCKEYDQERHCCPRWNKVIRKTVADYKKEYGFHSIKEKPDESGEYIIQYSDGRMEVEPFDADRNLFGRVVGVFDFASGKESEEFCLEDEDDMVAWARLPERYKNDDT